MTYEDHEADSLPPEQESEHLEVVREIAAERGFPLSDWRPKQPRIRDARLLELLKYEYDCCEITGVVDGLHLHHCLLRSQGGDDLRANIICVTDAFHTRYHASDAVARLMLAEYVVNNRPDTIAYLQRKLGHDGCAVWLEKHGVDAL